MALHGQFQKCGKCGCMFVEEENIGTLECSDYFYSVGSPIPIRIKADHRSMFGRMRSSLHWEEWVWTFGDNVHIESSIFKKLPRLPLVHAIVDITEYNKMSTEYYHMMTSVADSSEGKQDGSRMLMDDDHDRHDSFDSFSEDDFLSSGEDSDEIESVAIDSSSIIKTVCVARFDWREKFRVLSEIFKKDCDVMMESFLRPATTQKYWTTREYLVNPQKRREFDLRKKGLM